MYEYYKISVYGCAAVSYVARLTVRGKPIVTVVDVNML